MRRDAPFDFHPPHALPSFTKHSKPAINHLTRRGLFTIHGVLAFMDDRYTSPKNPIIPKNCPDFLWRPRCQHTLREASDLCVGEREETLDMIQLVYLFPHKEKTHQLM
ncbi:hypothetical protein TNCV_2844741 [Trichonephila clavipes]|nr:hypothetical protein TNCV_2844741 [Trichonephila clavipes]